MKYIWCALNTCCIIMLCVWINTSLYINKELEHQVHDIQIELNTYKNIHQIDTIIIKTVK